MFEASRGVQSFLGGRPVAPRQEARSTKDLQLSIPLESTANVARTFTLPVAERQGDH